MPLRVAAIANVASVAVPVVGQVAKGLASLPHLEDECVVTVVGQPGAKRRDLYFMALAAAFGVVRRFDAAQFLAPPPGLLMCEYAIGNEPEDHWVRVTLRYKTSLLSSSVAAALSSSPTQIGAAVGATLPGVGPIVGAAAGYAIDQYSSTPKSLPLYAEAAVYSGPRDEVIGMPFAFTGLAVPGIPTSATAKGAPQLPFAQRVIVTKADTCPDPNPELPVGISAVITADNPKPSGDNRSRGSVTATDPLKELVQNLLVPLVHSAIANPGSSYLQTFPAPTPGTGGG